MISSRQWWPLIASLWACQALTGCAGDDALDYACTTLVGPAIVLSAIDVESGSAVCGLTVIAAATFSYVNVHPDSDGCIVQVVGDDGIFDLAILAEGYELAKVVGLLVRLSDEKPCTVATAHVVVQLTPVAGDD